MNNPWQIPQSWGWVESREIAEIVGGGTPRTDDPTNFEEGDVPWITPADLSGYKDKHISRGARNITKKGLKNSGARVMPVGTVLFSSRAPIGYVAIASNPVSTNQGFKSFVLHPSIKPDYAYYYLQRAKDLAVELSSGTTFREISGAKAAQIPFPVAPRTEQERIVGEIEKQFTRLDAAVAGLTHVQANLKRYRAAVLKAACEGRLVPAEAELADREGRTYEPAAVLLERVLAERRSLWQLHQLAKARASGRDFTGTYNGPPETDEASLPSLPQGWKWATLSQLSEIQGGIQKQPSRRPATNPYPFLRVANVLRGRLDTHDMHKIELFEGELEKLRLNQGDLLIVEGNGSPSEIGRMAIWKDEIRNCVHQNHIIRARLLGGILPRYVEAFWNSPAGAATVLEVASSTSGLYTLSVSKVGRIPVPLPPFAEQVRIVGEIDRRLSSVEEIEGQVGSDVKRAARLRQAILKQAFEGKLVPQDPTDEAASVLIERIRAAQETSLKIVRSPIREDRNGRG